MLKISFGVYNPNILAGFTNRHDGLSKIPYDSLNLAFHVGDNKSNVQKNRNILIEKFKMNKLAWMNQVHATNIQVVERGGEVIKTDGLITSKINLTLMVMVADCIPILFYDPAQKVIAAAHSGREGSFDNIPGKMIFKMISKFKSDPKDIIVSMGPSIQKKCYEVSQEIASDFKEKWGKQFILNKQFLDLPNLNKNQLIEAGVVEENITIDNTCTHCNKDYFSYRRDKMTGRFAGVIMMPKL